MRKTAIAFLLILTVLFSSVTEVIFFDFTSAQIVENIKINKDGTVTPSNAPIISNGNLYTLSRDIFGSITIEKSSIVLDGSGHSINASSSFSAISSKPNPPVFGEYLLDITIRDFVIVQAGTIGIFIQDTNNSKIYNNTISNVQVGISVDIYGSGNTVIGNNLTKVNTAIYVWTPNNTITANHVTNCGNGISFADWAGNTVTGNHVENNTVGVNCFAGNPIPAGLFNLIYYNNFINNTLQFLSQLVVGYPRLVDTWDNGTVGNFWSDYNGTDANGDGIGDTPYNVYDHTQSAVNDTDNYPLMLPISLAVPYLPLPTTTPQPKATPSQTANPTSTPSSSPSPTSNSLATVSARMHNGATVDLTIKGNITTSQMSNVIIATDQSESTTTLSFTLTGQSGTTGFSNITIPIDSVKYGITPKIYVDGQPALNQDYTQDSNNYYVWYTIHFSSHQISIVFTMPSSPTPSPIDIGDSALNLAVAIIAVIITAVGFISMLILRRYRKTANLN